MKNVDKTDNPTLITMIERMWPIYHPWMIANELNARYGFEGRSALTATAVWNLHHAARRLDRDRAWG